MQERQAYIWGRSHNACVAPSAAEFANPTLPDGKVKADYLKANAPTS